MTRKEANAVNRARREAPKRDRDFRLVWRTVNKHRPQLEHFLRLHGWLETWQKSWRKLQDTLNRHAPGSVPWHEVVLQCLEHVQALARLRHEMASRPTNPKFPNLGVGRPQDIDRKIELLVLLHLRGNPAEEISEIGTHLLNQAMGTALPYPTPPWSKTALKALQKEMGWPMGLADDAFKPNKAKDLLPGNFAQIRMPHAFEVARFACDAYVLGAPGPEPQPEPQPELDGPMARLRVGIDFLAAFQDATAVRVKETSQARSLVELANDALEQALRIGRHVDPLFGQTLFIPSEYIPAEDVTPEPPG